MTDLHSPLAHAIGLVLAYGIGWVMGFNTGRNGRSRRARRLSFLKHNNPGMSGGDRC